MAWSRRSTTSAGLRRRGLRTRTLHPEAGLALPDGAVGDCAKTWRRTTTSFSRRFKGEEERVSGTAPRTSRTMTPRYRAGGRAEFQMHSPKTSKTHEFLATKRPKSGGSAGPLDAREDIFTIYFNSQCIFKELHQSMAGIFSPTRGRDGDLFLETGTLRVPRRLKGTKGASKGDPRGWPSCVLEECASPNGLRRALPDRKKGPRRDNLRREGRFLTSTAPSRRGFWSGSKASGNLSKFQCDFGRLRDNNGAYFRQKNALRMGSRRELLGEVAFGGEKGG